MTVLGMSQTACVQKTTLAKASASDAAGWVNSYLGSWQWNHESSCDYARAVKNGNTFSDNKNTMYYCTKVGAPTVHVKVRMFEDGNITREDVGGSEISYSHRSDLDPCFFNLQIAGSTIYDFYGLTLNGAKEMTGFQEFKLSNSTQTDWTCTLTTNADI